VIYLNGRIGIVISGAAFVKNHPATNLVKPRILYKADEGSIIGFEAGENCGGLSVNPLTWIIT
jgi:hypothetical protein|tara:strand:+ start:472 stop:660 length:189 start_codon:yes stop_codon:yes gene_type:complete